MDTFDRFIENLQQEIFEDTRRAYGEKGFQRWRNPLYRGRMENPDAHAKINHFSHILTAQKNNGTGIAEKRKAGNA